MNFTSHRIIAPPTMPITNTGSKYYQDLLVGCLLAIGGNLLISVSLNIQKYSHMKNAENVTNGGSEKNYLRNPWWWLGLILMGLGEIGNFSAYGYAPASVVAPLGTTTVIVNTIIAVTILKERLRPEDLFGGALAIVGAFLLINFSSKTEEVRNSAQIVAALTQTSFIVYLVVEVIMLIIMFLLLYLFKVENVLVLILICSITASFTVISAKASSGLIQLTARGFSQFHSPVIYIMLVVMIATAIFQVKYLNQAMKLFDATVVVPTNFVFFTISAILAGIMFYQELWGMQALDIFMFLFGCFLCFVGVFFITVGKSDNKADDTVETEKRKKFLKNLLPTWWLSSVVQQPVQPSASDTTSMASRGQLQSTSTIDSCDSETPVLTKSMKYEDTTSFNELVSNEEPPTSSKEANE